MLLRKAQIICATCNSIISISSVPNKLDFKILYSSPLDIAVIHKISLFLPNSTSFAYMVLCAKECLIDANIYVIVYMILTYASYCLDVQESTKEAEVIAVAERSGNGGLQVYEFEYKIDSTRGGMKRIFTAAFVASKKLYLLNIVHSDNPESPLDPDKRLMLEQVLHSFDLTS